MSAVNELNVAYNSDVAAKASADAAALKAAGAAAEYAEERVTRARKSALALANQYGDNERLTSKLAANTRRFAADMEALEKSELDASEKSRLRASILAQEEIAIRKITMAHRARIAAEKEANSSVRDFGEASSSAVARIDKATSSVGRFRGSMGQAGFQIADAASQISMGTSAFSAIGMQAGQFLGALGPMGAAIGAVVTVGGVLTGSLLSQASAADAGGTAFTNYGKAMELAKTVSGELTGSSGLHRQALEAERRSILDAKEAVVQKALAEVTAAETAAAAARLSAESGAPEMGLAAGLYDAAADDLSKRFKTLRSELTQLSASFGSYNDGARAVWANTTKGGQATADYRAALTDLNKGLGETVSQLKLEVDGQSLSSAAKMRAKLTSEALRAAGLAEAKALPDVTRGLIEQAVAYQEKIDAMQAAEKQRARDATSAATAAKQYDGVVDGLDRQIEAQTRLLDIVGMSAEEQRRANEQTLLATELAKAHVAAGAKESAVIAEKVRRLSDLQSQTSNRGEIAGLQERLALLNRQNAALQGSIGDHDQIIQKIGLQSEAVKRYGDATSTAAQEWFGLKSSIYDAEMQKKRFTPADEFPEGAADDLNTMIGGVFS